MNHPRLHTGLYLLALLAPTSAFAADPTYWDDVRPLLRKHCTVCHNVRSAQESDLSGGLALDSYAAVLVWKEKKRDLVKAGKSADSALYKSLISDDEEKRMPLRAKPLPAEELTLIKRWIDSGAKEGTKPADTPIVVTPTKSRKLDILIPTAANPGATLALKIGPLSPITALAFSPNGKLLVSGTYGSVTVWDAATGKPVRVLTNVLAAVNDLRFSPDGKLLVVAGGQPSAKGDLRLFTTDDWKLKAVFGGHEDVVNSVAFDKEGKRLISGSYDRTARIWDVASAKTLRMLTMHSDFVLSVAFSPDGKHVFSGSKDRSVRMTEADTGKSMLTFSDRNEDVLAVAAHPDGKSVVATGVEPGLSVWNTQTGEKIRSQAGHRGPVYEIAFTPDGKRLVSAGSDGTVGVYNGVTGVAERRVTVGSLCYSVAISPDGKRLAAGSFDGLTRVYDAGTGNALATMLSLSASNDWLLMAPAGYVGGSDALLKQGRWSIAGKPAAETVAKTLTNAEFAAKSLRGEAVPAAGLGK